MYDVIVCGAGNSALSTALSAYECGAKVLVLEKSPKEMRGGNTKWTLAQRFTYKGLNDICELVPDLTDAEKEGIDFGSYSESDFYSDLMEISKGKADPMHVELVVKNSWSVMKWLAGLGVKWIPTGGFSIETRLKKGGKSQLPAGRPLEFSGGGYDYINHLFSVAEKRGIDIRYETQAVKLLMANSDERCIQGIRVLYQGKYEDIPGHTVVLACGGYEASPEWRARYLGKDWDLINVRGSKYNTGDGLRMAMEIGAQMTGHWSCAHATSEDYSSPKFGELKGIDYSRQGYRLGILVNLHGERFMDEGENVADKTYAKIGRTIVPQEDGIAIQIYDAKVRHLLQTYYKDEGGIVAKSIEEFANKLSTEVGVNRERLLQTIKEYNTAVQDTKFDALILDGKCTQGITPAKTNWALKIDTPPFYGFPVVPGITFAFGGIKIDETARVLDIHEMPIPGLYAVGEIVGFWYHNYLAAADLTQGSVMARIAAADATTYAHARAR